MCPKKHDPTEACEEFLQLDSISQFGMVYSAAAETPPTARAFMLSRLEAMRGDRVREKRMWKETVVPGQKRNCIFIEVGKCERCLGGEVSDIKAMFK